MLQEAARLHDLDLTASWMVGDGLTDIQAGRAAGCKTILVTALKVEQIQRFFSAEVCIPDALVGNLNSATKQL